VTDGLFGGAGYGSLSAYECSGSYASAFPSFLKDAVDRVLLKHGLSVQTQVVPIRRARLERCRRLGRSRWDLISSPRRTSCGNIGDICPTNAHVHEA